MKKVLSVFLAVLMVFSFMAVTAFANEGTPDTTDPATTEPETYFYGVDKNTQCVFLFRLDGGKPKNGQYVYNKTTGQVDRLDAEEISGSFILVPTEAGMYVKGSKVTLPDVVAPSGRSFQGWERKASNNPAKDNDGVVIPGEIDNDTHVYSVAERYEIKSWDIGSVVEFTAVYGTAAVEEDTFAKVFDILIKVFGAIIGVIAYQGNVEKGQEFMSKIFSSLA